MHMTRPLRSASADLFVRMPQLSTAVADGSVMSSRGSSWVLTGFRTTRPPLAFWYLLGGFGVLLAYFQVGSSGAVGQVLLYCLLSASAPAAILYGTRRYRPRRAWCWVLLAAGMAVSTAADATFY